MHPNEALIHKFYDAFKAGDHATMGSVYAKDVQFEDPIFTLNGFEAAAMWQMLTSRPGASLNLDISGIEANDTTGKAHWEAKYEFEGRPVHNVIDATFTFKDGLVTHHKDVFSFFAWSKMAMGPLGYVLGWTPILPMIVRNKARQGLDKFIAKNELS